MQNEKINIEVKIGAERISLSVPFDTQVRVRDTEHAINRLYQTWRSRFPNRSESQLLAMIAYQYASFYAELHHRNEDNAVVISECLQSLDNILESQDSPKV